MLKKANNKVMIAALTVAILLGVVFIVSGMKSTPEKTLTQYSNAISEGDQKKSIKFVAPEKRSLYENGLEQLGEIFFGEVSNVKTNIIVDKLTYSEDKKSVDVSCFVTEERAEGADTEYTTIHMIMAGGKWYIDGELF